MHHLSGPAMVAVHLLLAVSIATLFFPHLSHSATETECLLQLKSSLNHAGALNNWDANSSPCAKKWVGVICIGGVITGLHLSDLGLSGTINIDALHELHSLRTISFTNNSFSGPIPEFNKIGKLKALLLAYNNFSGDIASDFFTSMGSLKKVWLSNNNFSGNIPPSVMQIPLLFELHLEYNHFSGPIPPSKQKLTSFDVSNNNLEGEIPESLSTQSAKSFAGNNELCGKPLDSDCSKMETPPPESSVAVHVPSGEGNSSRMIIGMIIIAVMAVLVLASVISSRKRQREDDFSVLMKERSFDEAPPKVRTDISVKKPPSESSRRGGSVSSKRGSSRHGMGDLIMVNHDKGIFGLQDLMKAAAEVMGNGGLGSSYKAVMANGLSVVVKRMREMNKIGRDGFDTEMRRFGRIAHKNILTPLAYHYRKEEKLLVSEYMPKGSLLYVLHGDRGAFHADLNWPTRLNIIKGIASGLHFLHTEYATYELPHGNIKSSNVVLSDSYKALITDYALHPLTNLSYATQAMFAYKSPEFVQHQQVSPKADVYCLGIIILEVMTGKFPSQYLANGKGGTDVVQWALQACLENKEQELIDPEILNSANSVDQMVQLLRIGVACAESNPAERLEMDQVIRSVEDIHV